ncbi:MAG: HhH-GPD family protein [Gemmatimonadetes bacterium]|jgi:DNA-3-methyladenine glycosylase II|nr:HhH-GPD family protein [Gemmatimonadota bacterium]
MPAAPRSALSHLRRADPVLGAIIDRVGPCRLEVKGTGTHYDALVRSIVYQQLSGKAAGTIHRRLLALYPGGRARAELVLGTSDERLRGAGLSRQKIGYLRDLSARVADRSLPLAHLGRLPDDAIIEHLVQVKGIGRWTAQMFLMFRLGRPDVLPELDLGVQNAIRLAYGLPSRPTPKDVLRIGAPWRPWASVASWYLWRSLENGDGQLGA